MSLVEAVLTDPIVFEKQSVSAESIFQGPSTDYEELLIRACRHGNTFVVRKTAEAGAEVNHGESIIWIPPILAVQITGQTAVADLLVEMGATPIDPLESEFRDMLQSGIFAETTRGKAYKFG